MFLGESGEKKKHKASWDYTSCSDVENRINASSFIKNLYRFNVCFSSKEMDTIYTICVLTFPLSKGFWCSRDWENLNTSYLSSFPNKIICTLASVPAPLLSPVYTLIVYSCQTFYFTSFFIQVVIYVILLFLSSNNKRSWDFSLYFGLICIHRKFSEK